MGQVDVVRVLNLLLQIEQRSLPMYTQDAAPEVHNGESKTLDAVRAIVINQQEASRRILELIDERGGVPDYGGFPMEYTDLHMVSLGYLLQELVRCQHRDVARVERCVAALAGDRPAQALAEEILGQERAHLEQLTALAGASRT